VSPKELRKDFPEPSLLPGNGQSPAAPRLLFLITEDWYFWSHRKSIAGAARDAGFDVSVATRAQNHGDLIEREGFRLIPIKLRRKSRNPFAELSAIAELASIYKKERPSIVHHVGIKPVLYGSLAACLAGVPAVVNALAGLGYLFVAKGRRAPLLKHFARLSYRLALSKKCSRVIFQNKEDQKLFIENGLVTERQSVLIRGAGVNLDDFGVLPEPNDIPVIMLAGRLLWNKGIGELVEAAERLRATGMKCRLVLVGVPDLENPMAVPEEVLRRWQAEGKIEWWGRREDMPQVLAQSNIVVLPTTYGEGVPKILLEATACGRAIVTTDAPGCREIVRHGENGLLVPPHDAEALANAIRALLCDPPLRAKMGARGRGIAEAEFSEQKVVAETLAVYRDLLAECPAEKN
jgi:glycosyltransferase involved in cell wall biosynthesis